MYKGHTCPQGVNFLRKEYWQLTPWSVAFGYMDRYIRREARTEHLPRFTPSSRPRSEVNSDSLGRRLWGTKGMLSLGSSDIAI
jgi:hypothetical protein